MRNPEISNTGTQVVRFDAQKESREATIFLDNSSQFDWADAPELGATVMPDQIIQRPYYTRTLPQMVITTSVIRQQNDMRLQLNSEDFSQFINHLMTPPKANEALHSLFREFSA